MEFDPAEKLKLLDLTGLPAVADVLRMLLLLLMVVVFAAPIPPKANGLFGACAAVGAGAAAAPNENGAGVEEVVLDWLLLELAAPNMLVVAAAGAELVAPNGEVTVEEPPNTELK